MLRDPEGGLQNSAMSRGMTEERFNFHRSLAEKLDQPFVERYDQKNVRAYTDMYADAIKLMRSKDLAAFDLGMNLGRRHGLGPFHDLSLDFQGEA